MTPDTGSEPRTWLLYFEDPDRGYEMFTDEAAAWRRYEDVNASWTCTLFAQASVAPDDRPAALRVVAEAGRAADDRLARVREAARDREKVWSRLFVDSYCSPEKFETCGDPFCVEARGRRDAALPAADRAEPEVGAVSLGSILTLTAAQNAALAADRIVEPVGLAESERRGLVTLVRIGFLVRIGNRRAEATDVVGDVRPLLMAILQAEDTEEATVVAGHLAAEGPKP